MQQLVSGMAAMTEAALSPSEQARKTSVAETLDHARRALSVHKEWLQRRLSVDEGELADGDTPEETGEQWMVADMENEEEEEEITLELKGPQSGGAASSAPLSADSKRRRGSNRVAPSLEVLEEEEGEVGAVTGHRITPGKRDTERVRNGGSSQDPNPPNSKRPRSRWTSRAAVFPVTSNSTSDTSSTPLHLFTTSTPSHPTTSPESVFSPSQPPQDHLTGAWGSLSSLDNYMESLQTLADSVNQTPDQSTALPAALKVSGNSTSSSDHQEEKDSATEPHITKQEKLSNDASITLEQERPSNDPSVEDSVPLSSTEGDSLEESVSPAVAVTVSTVTAPVDLERHGTEVSALASDSTATILTVGPAPREKQSSYEVHRVSKLDEAGRGVRLVEIRVRDPTELNSASEVRITPGQRVVVGQSESLSELAALEEVLPYQNGERGTAATGGAGQDREDSVFSDDEVFEPESQTPSPAELKAATATKSLSVDGSGVVTDTSSSVKIVPESLNCPFTASDAARVTEKGGERSQRERSRREGIQREGGQREGIQREGIQREGRQRKGEQREGSQRKGEQREGSQRKGEQREGGQREGGQREGREMGGGNSSVQSGGGELSFRPRVTSTPAGLLERATPGEGGSDVREEELCHPQLSQLKLSRKREREPPAYTAHYSTPSGLALNPPCPQYGAKQPSFTPGSLMGRRRIYSAPTSHPDHPSHSEQVDSQSENDPPSERHHLRLRHSMSTPEGDRRALNRADSPLAESRRMLEANGVRGSTSSLYHLQSGPGPLHLAAKAGNTRQVQSLISHGENVDTRDHEGRTPLMYCIHSRGVHLACASLLIQAGAAVNKQASDGSTAIHLASPVGAISLIEFAILNNADPDVRDFEGRLPIHWSTMTRQSSKCTAILLKHSKLDINAMDDAGMTPLMWAAYNNNPLVTEFLLSKGADCEEKDKDGMTAMHWAIHQEGVRCLELLLKADHTYFKDHRGRTVLHLSAEAGSLTACELILHLRGDAIHDLDRMGRTPLHYGAACSRVDVCVLLLDRGSDAAHRDLAGKTAVEYARQKKFDYVVALLTCHGTSVADFMRSSRSGSVSSLLNKAKSFSDLPSHEDAPDIITESLQPLAEETVGDPQPDVSLGNGAFLGRFVPDKKDPVQHFFFWVEGTQLRWSRRVNRRRPQEAIVYQVHSGPSKQLQRNSAYSPNELHQHVFWLLTDSGVMDLFAYNDTSFQNWLTRLGRITRGTPKSGQLGAENHPSEESVGLGAQGGRGVEGAQGGRGVEGGRVERKRLRWKHSAEVAPALVIENEARESLVESRERWSESSQTLGQDSEVELQSLTSPEAIRPPKLQGPPQNSTHDVI